MAEKYDAAARLAEGSPAVENLQAYVWACHLLGYQHPDLTLHASQLRDWYGTEDGMDLRALDADCARLEATLTSAQEALGRQRDQHVAVSAAWQGGGADAAHQFLRRHDDAAATVTAAVRTAAETLATLREDLWRAVDGKVAATCAIDDRALGRRADWLAAAHTVTVGTGDRSAASELVDREVKPFVDNGIRLEWLTAMRTAAASVADAYTTATRELTAERVAVFDIPGELGPRFVPVPAGDVRAGRTAAVTPAGSVVPTSASAGPPPAWSTPPAAFAPFVPSPAAAAPPPPQEPAVAPALAPAMSPLGTAGTPDVGGGAAGLGQQLADVVGSLLGSSDGGLFGARDIDEPALDTSELDAKGDPDADDPDDDRDVDGPDDDRDVDDPDLAGQGDAPNEDTADHPVVDGADACDLPTASAQAQPAPVETPTAPAEPPPEPATTSTPAVPPPPVDPPVPPPSESSEPSGSPVSTGTPCEIAADEVPQVGDGPK